MKKARSWSIALISGSILFLLGTTIWAEEDWNEFKGQHFLIYYQNAPLDFVRNVEESAENEYEEIARNMGFTRYEGWNWEKRAQIYIYDDQEQYVASSNIPWSHGVALAQDKIIKTFPSAYGFFDSTLPHELGHVIFREFVGYKAQIPLWLEEGVAMYQEKAKRWGANKSVQEAMKNKKFIPLPELTSGLLRGNPSQEAVQLFYDESASIVYFMITELGEYRFVNFCRELREGKKFEDALREAYVRFQDMDDLNKVWEKYLMP